jgi:N-formylglutamate amidohydrolase
VHAAREDAVGPDRNLEEDRKEIKLMYAIEISYSEEDEGFIATVPELPGCSAFGENEEQALKEVKIAMLLWLKTAKEIGRDIPHQRERINIMHQIKISNREATIPVITHVPHGSTFIPEDVRNSIILSDMELQRELLLMTDRYTPELFEGTVAMGGLSFVNNYSRLVVDPERFEDDNDEIMYSRGMGAVYIKTAHQQELRKDPTEREKEVLLSTYFRPYHKALEFQVQKILNRFGRCLIIDCHSFSSKALPYELDQSPVRPDICLGTDPFHTSGELITSARSFCEANGLNVAIDKPFMGTYVPIKYFGEDKRISSIMIEVNRSLYMDDKTGDKLSSFSEVKRMIDGLIKEVMRSFIQ